MVKKSDCDLSVIIISRNEEEMIADCIESVLKAIENAYKKGLINSSEVILSDSASTDQTIDISMRYPIKIVQLKKEWKLSASAGRYIGYLYSKGNYIMFMDGDCVLDEYWLCISIPYLEDGKVGGIDGIEKEFIEEQSPFQAMFKLNEFEIKDVVEVDVVGKGLFKREVLEKVGPYHPYLIGGEDRDISYRIRAKGYKLLRLPHIYVTHYWAKKEGKLTLRRYLKSVYVWSKGDGQALRSSLKNKKVTIQYLKRYYNTSYIKIYGTIFLFIALVHMNIITLFLGTQFSVPLIFTSLIDFVLLLLGGSYAFMRKKGGKWEEFLFSFYVVPYAFIRHIGFTIGFIDKPKVPAKYPRDVKIIKDYQLETSTS
jgi:glycosyltransferase involved in cell wall biosynthesis